MSFSGRHPQSYPTPPIGAIYKGSLFDAISFATFVFYILLSTDMASELFFPPEQNKTENMFALPFF